MGARLLSPAGWIPFRAMTDSPGFLAGSFRKAHRSRPAFSQLELLFFQAARRKAVRRQMTGLGQFGAPSATDGPHTRCCKGRMSSGRSGGDGSFRRPAFLLSEKYAKRPGHLVVRLFPLWRRRARGQSCHPGNRLPRWCGGNATPTAFSIPRHPRWLSLSPFKISSEKRQVTGGR